MVIVASCSSFAVGHSLEMCAYHLLSQAGGFFTGSTHHPDVFSHPRQYAIFGWSSLFLDDIIVRNLFTCW